MTRDVSSPAELSIVIPALNEAERIGPTLERLRRYAESRAAQWEVIIVDDGSTDATADVVRSFPAAPLTLRLLHNERNRGKGYSSRVGVLQAGGAHILISDADLSTPIEEIEKLAPWLERGFDIVIASRDLPTSELRPAQPLLRRIMGTTFRELRRRIILPELRDTQCGFKLYDAACARRLFALQTISGFGFDCEILALASRLGYRVKEVGVVWCNDPNSRVRPVRDPLIMLGELALVTRRIRRIPRSPEPAGELTTAGPRSSE